MNDSLAIYWNTPNSLSAHTSFCLGEGEGSGKQSTCRSIAWGQGNTLYLEDTLTGQQEETELSLGRHLWLYFPKDVAGLQASLRGVVDMPQLWI